MRAMAFALLVWGCGPPASPSRPDGASPLPEGLAGSWHSDVQGVSLELDPEGTFTWKQGDLTKTGAFWVEGKWLVLAVDKRYKTQYAIVELAAGRLVIQDPAGTRVAFSGGPDTPPASGADAPAGDLVGVWANVEFAVRIELGGDGTFVWKQGDLVETGTYSVASGAIHMTTGGHTSAYGIVSRSDEELVIRDPSGNQLSLAHVESKGPGGQPEPIGKASLLAGAPPIKIVDLGKGGDGPTLSGGGDGKTGSLPSGAVSGPGGIFHFVPPGSWKVDEQKVCGNKFTSMGMKYTCWKRNDLLSGQAARVHFDIGVWVTWAAPGALEKVSPGIDAMLAAYDQDRTSVSDDISQMNGYEVFSTRIDGRDGGSDNQLKGRIIGVHFGDLLLVGVLALSTDPETLAAMGGDIDEALDSMSFDFPANDALGEAVQGSWAAGGRTWTFWSDGTYLKGEETGSWAVHGSMLVMAADPQGEGEVAAHPVSIEDGVLTFGEHTLKRK